MNSNHPNLFLIGVPKAGTSALALELSKHTDIFMKHKEPRFYDAHVYYDNECYYRTDSLISYLSYFADWNKQKYALDASNLVAYDLQSVREITNSCHNALFILILRDPIKASLSMHAQRLKSQEASMREVSENFEECWTLLSDRSNGNGYPEGVRNKFLFRYDKLYSYQHFVPELVDLLGEKLLVILYEDYLRSPNIIHRKIFEFLNLGYEEVPSLRVNNSYIVKPNIFSGNLKKLKRSSIKLRKYLRLTGGFYTKLGNFFDRLEVRKNVEYSIDIKFEQELLEYFKKSYEVMDIHRDTYSLR